MVVPPSTVTGPGSRSRPVNRLDQVSIAHRELSMPPFPQARRAGSSPTADMMSTFALGRPSPLSLSQQGGEAGGSLSRTRRHRPVEGSDLAGNKGRRRTQAPAYVAPLHGHGVTNGTRDVWPGEQHHYPERTVVHALRPVPLGPGGMKTSGAPPGGECPSAARNGTGSGLPARASLRRPRILLWRAARLSILAYQRPRALTRSRR
jgi:hypothetical protein